MLEAATLLSTDQEEFVLFAAYDVPAPFPLFETRPLIAPFAIAFVLGKRALPESVSMLDITVLSEHNAKTPTAMLQTTLESLRLGNPAARGLPLLQTIAKNLTTSIFLNYLDNPQLRIDHQPCQSSRD
jgi:hypothetical protein